MRDIKFRGLKRDTWMYGFYCYRRNVDVHLICGNSIEFPVDGKTISEFTGLKDDNKKEIYEGDILEFYWNSDSCWGKEGTYKGYVTFSEGVFEVNYIGREKITTESDGCWHENSQSDDIKSLISWSEDIKVIGNLYENPELLKVEIQHIYIK